MSQIVEREIWSVTDLVTYLYQTLDQDEKLKRVWLEAEISNFIQNNKSKHMYFTLKDDYAKVKSAMFAGNNRRLRFLPRDGDRVLVRGYLSVYDREGQIQFYVQDMRASGAGDLFVAFERLKEKLALEGLFSDLKKPIPVFSMRVGVVTSLSGAVLHDILTTLKRRFPMISILVVPVSVQGENAPFEIARAIEIMNARNEVDVLIVGRGGGSIEEIWAFNEEVVARSIYHSIIPVISAVGHETDTTISDFVADVRAATPTAAAEMVAPHQQEIRERIVSLKQRIRHAQSSVINRYQNRLIRSLHRPVFQHPEARLVQYIQRLDDLCTNLAGAVQNNVLYLRHRVKQYYYGLEYQNPGKRVALYSEKISRLSHEGQLHTANYLKHARLRLIHLCGQLDALSPLNVMKRGYSLVYRSTDEKLIMSQNEVQKEDYIYVRLAEGQLKCQVLELEGKA